MLGELLTLQTFWKNDGKREGTITVGLYELKPETNTWSPALSTLQDGNTVITLDAQSSSVLATFKWESYEAGQPLLVLVVEDPETGEPDFENINGQNIDITGINVQPLPIEEESSATLYIVLGISVIAVALVAIIVMRSRGDDEYYYDDEEEYYEEDKGDWEYEEEDDN
jgi:hypothetical protein